MRHMILFLLAVLTFSSNAIAQTDSEVKTPKNFIYFGLERAGIKEPKFLESNSVVGAQLKYTWKELEPERDLYELQPVLDDLAYLESHGKKLFIQIQEVSFDESIVNVPQYLREDPEFGGGVAHKLEFDDDDESNPKSDGWVARRWDPDVQDRFIKLLNAMGKVLDGRIEGINLPETSIGFGNSGKYHPPGYTFESYREGVKAIMTGARKAFPESTVIQYANFMPGEWLPWTDKGYLKSVYEHAEEIGLGVGGPDVLPHRRGQRNHSLPLIRDREASISAGLAVQSGNLSQKNPSTGERVTVPELYSFSADSLKLDYIFWGIQEPYYTGEILPFLNGLKKKGMNQ